MSGVLARRVASTPVRSAAETWNVITELLAPDPGSTARTDLAAAAGVACSSIASEATKEAAIVVWGSGPRIRVYCVFDEDAITQDGVNEGALPKCATDGDWRMSIPCLAEDVKWCSDKLAAVTSRITARAMDEDLVDEKIEARGAAVQVTINPAEFFKS